MSAWSSRSDELPNANTAGNLRQGDRTQDCQQDKSPRTGPLINPPAQTRFQERLQEHQEGIYDRRRTASCRRGPSGRLVWMRYDELRQRVDKALYPVPFNSRYGPVEMFEWPGPHLSGGGDVLYTVPCSKLREGPEREKMLLTVVRQQLKNMNYENLPSLLQAFRYYDEKGHGRIDKEDLKKVCREFQLNVSEFLLGELIDYCDVDKDGMINFLQFANFLNWKDKMPISQEEQRILTSGEMNGCFKSNTEQKLSTASATSLRAEAQEADTEKQAGPKILARFEDLEPVKVGSNLKTTRTLSRTRATPERFITSSSAICATVGDLAGDNRTYGVPSVRTDLAVPDVKRVSDQTNYGEEGTAFALLFPSSYLLEERQFLSPRTKSETGPLINPPAQTRFQERLQEHQEGIYDRRRTASCRRGSSGRLVWKRYDEFRQRVDKALYPVPVNSRYGPVEMFEWPGPHLSGGGDVLYTVPCSKLREGPEREKMLLIVVRQQLKNMNYENLPSLLQAFRYYDEKGHGRIDKEVLKKVCREFQLNVSEFLLGELIDYCDVDKDGMINFLQFANFLNWKEKMPISQEEQRIFFTKDSFCEVD